MINHPNYRKYFLQCILVGVVFRIFFIVNHETIHTDDTSSFCRASLTYNQTSTKYKMNTWYQEGYLFDEFYKLDIPNVDYKRVADLCAVDNHPPFYFWMLHFFQSASIGGGPPIIAGYCLNLLFFVLNAIIFIRLSRVFIKSEKVVLFTLACYCLNTGTFQGHLYIRAYEFLCLLNCTVAYLIFSDFVSDKISIKKYFSIGIILMVFFLSHHYSIVFAGGLMGIVVFHYTLIKTDYFKLLNYSITYILAFLASLVVFPASVSQLLGHNRGGRVINAASGGNDFTFYMDHAIMGIKKVGLFYQLPYVIVFILIFWLLVRSVKHSNLKALKYFKQNIYIFYLLIYSFIVYAFLMIFSPAPLLRYVHAVIPFFILVFGYFFPTNILSMKKFLIFSVIYTSMTVGLSFYFNETKYVASIFKPNNKIADLKIGTPICVVYKDDIGDLHQIVYYSKHLPIYVTREIDKELVYNEKSAVIAIHQKTLTSSLRNMLDKLGYKQTGVFSYETIVFEKI